MPRPHAFVPEVAPSLVGAGYPKPFDAIAVARARFKLGDHAGLTQFGVNYVVLPPGEGSSQRHWHSSEDEFVYVLAGELTLVTDDGEEVLGAGMCAGFPAGIANAHHLLNRSDADACFLEVGTRAPRDECSYPDIDLHLRVDDDGERFTRKDGTPLSARYLL